MYMRQNKDNEKYNCKISFWMSMIYGPLINYIIYKIAFVFENILQVFCIIKY